MAGAKKFRPDWYVGEVGKRLLWVRQIARLTQSDVAAALGCSRQTVNDYESGVRDPDPYLMVIFCARFKVTMDYIFRGDVIGCDRALTAQLLLAHPELAQAPLHTAHRMGISQA